MPNARHTKALAWNQCQSLERARIDHADGDLRTQFVQSHFEMPWDGFGAFSPHAPASLESHRLLLLWG